MDVVFYRSGQILVAYSMGTVETEDDSGVVGPGLFPHPFSQPGLTGRPEAVPVGLDLLVSLSRPDPIATIEVGGEERAEQLTWVCSSPHYVSGDAC